MKQNEWTVLGKRVLYAAGSAVAATLLLCMLLGMLIEKEWIQPELGGSVVKILSVTSVFLLSYGAARRSKQNRLPVSMGISVVYCLVCLLCKAVMFPTWGIKFGWGIVATLLSSAGAGVMAKQKTVRRRR